MTVDAVHFLYKPQRAKRSFPKPVKAAVPFPGQPVVSAVLTPLAGELAVTLQDEPTLAGGVRLAVTEPQLAVYDRSLDGAFAIGHLVNGVDRSPSLRHSHRS